MAWQALLLEVLPSAAPHGGHPGSLVLCTQIKLGNSDLRQVFLFSYKITEDYLIQHH